MPVLDMPLADLEKYRGRNPKPRNFDAFWDAGLAEIDQLDLQVDKRPRAFAQPAAECFDLFFSGTGGARVHAKLLVPKHLKVPAPAIIHFHGYTYRAADWADLMSYVAAGFVVAAMDCRGQAGESTDTVTTYGPTKDGHIIRGLSDPDPRSLYYRNVFLDTALLARIVLGMPEVDPSRVGATGGSQGGGLTCACAALEPRVSRITPVMPFLSDYKRVWEMDLDVAAYAELRTYFRHFDPRHEREEAIFEKLGYIDVHHLAPRIKAETLMFTGLLDGITPPSTVYAVYNNINAPKRMMLYPDFGHEGLPGANDLAYEFQCRS